MVIACETSFLLSHYGHARISPDAQLSEHATLQSHWCFGYCGNVAV